MSHAPLAPSAAHRWLHCAASVLAERGFPDTSSKEADEGSAMHEVRARCLRDGSDPFDFEGWLFFGGTRRGFVATPKRLDALLPGLDRLDDLCGDILALRRQEPRYIIVEEKVFFEDKALADVYGTLDFGAYLRETVIVSDLKFGRGVPVFAENNEQQLIYVALLLDQLTRAERRRIKEIRIIIDQPRNSEGGGEWVITPDFLARWLDEVLYPGVERAQSRTPDYAPGPKTCFWCKAKASCVAHTEYNIKTLGITFNDERDGSNFNVEGVEKLSPERRTYLLKHREMIVKWLAAIHDTTLADALAGRYTAGMKAINGRAGNRDWEDEKAAAKALTAVLGDKAYHPRKLLSPAQAEDELPRAEMAKLKKYIKRGDPSPKLVPIEHKSPAIEPIEMKDER